jgi:hypothetical protein
MHIRAENPFYRFVTSGNRCIALHRSSVVKCVYWRDCGALVSYNFSREDIRKA